MPTKNIECQLAQGQIGRYLNGERFSPQAIQQLEAHVAECDECSELVTRRRQALMTMLGEGANRAAVMATPSPSAEKGSESSAERLISALGVTKGIEGDPPPVAAKDPSKSKLFIQTLNSKPLLYCAALAAVLLAMSYFSKGALKTFGPTADSATATKKEFATPPVTASSLKPAESTPPSTAVIPAPTKSPALETTTRIRPKVSAAPTSDYDADADLEVPAAPVKHVAKPRTRRSRAPKLVFRKASSRRIRRASSRRVARIHRWHRRGEDDRLIRISSSPKLNRHRASSTQSTIKIYDAQGRSIQQ